MEDPLLRPRRDEVSGIGASETYSAGRQQRRRDVLPRYGWAGALTALLLVGSSFTPSLLPRSAVLQGLVAGIAGAFGYGVGELVGWALARVMPWRPTRAVRRVLLAVGGVFAVVMLVAGWHWQTQLHELMGIAAPAGYDSAVIVLVALLVFVSLVALGRSLRRLTRWVLRHTIGRLPLWLGRTIAVATVAILVVGVLSGVVFRTFVAVSNKVFSVRDTTTDSGAVRPTAPQRSGSPESVIPWDTLGRQGRNFVGRGANKAEIASFANGQAMEPIRVYAGLQSAPTVHDRVELIVRDLQRAGAFDRSALVVVTTTGTGWVDPASVDAVEYMLGGNTAIAAMQYSYLPSWISFLVDKSKAQEAGVALFEGVYDAWSKLPTDTRPRLYVFGESLGAYGGQEAFPTLDALATRTGGAVLAGTPNFTELWSTLVAHRDDGSPERLPVYQQGKTARWAATPYDLTQPPDTWTTPRVAYLQHASDPIVWWSPSLLLHEPDWLREPPGSDVLPGMRWLPWVTFWQLTADLVFSTGVPDGHGHVYKKEYVDAWAAATQPPGWTAADTNRLRKLLG
jgi:uncharacterized membrane protein